MNCSACGEISESNVNFCRKCGAILNPSASGDTSAITRPMMREVVPFFPKSGEPVVPLTKAAPDEMTRVKGRGHIDILDYNDFTTIEEPLRFTVDETSIRAELRETLQLRGLLRIEEKYDIEINNGQSFDTVKCKHIELYFPLRDTAKYDPNRRIDFNKIRIHLSWIESVSFKRRLSKSRLIIKLQFAPGIYELNIDPIDRELVLYISWKDVKLAKRYLSAIMMQVSDAKLKKLLNKM